MVFGSRYGCTHVASIIYVFWVPSGSDSRTGRNAVVNRVDISEGVHVYF